MDRESVITHLQIIHTWAEFARKRDLQFFTPKHLENIAQWADDALNLLKERKPVKPTWNQGKAYCGQCGQKMPRKCDGIERRYCSFCGQAVKWNDKDCL